jgi:hypothetical protein
VLHRRSLTLLVVVLVPALLAASFVVGWLPTALERINGEPAHGWKRLSLDLPTTYAGGDASGADLDEVVRTLKGMGGQDYSSLADAIQEARTRFAFWAFDLDSLSSSRFPTGVSISRDAVILDSDVALADMANLMTKSLPPEFDVKESEPIQIGAFQGHRLKIVTRALDVDVEQAMYLVRNGSTIWKITFATPASQFDTRLITFERSVQTLTLN